MRLVHPATYTKNTTTRNGNSVYDDATLFEFLIQKHSSRLSWITILNKGRISGKHSTISTIKNSLIQEDKVQALLLDGIIRNKLKVRSAVSNAFMMIQEEFGSFSNTFGQMGTYNQQSKTLKEVPATTPFCTISTDLKAWF
jgi:3-methyladenine DNA glycosylase Tag